MSEEKEIIKTDIIVDLLKLNLYLKENNTNAKLQEFIIDLADQIYKEFGPKTMIFVYNQILIKMDKFDLRYQHLIHALANKYKYLSPIIHLKLNSLPITFLCKILLFFVPKEIDLIGNTCKIMKIAARDIRSCVSNSYKIKNINKTKTFYNCWIHRHVKQLTINIEKTTSKKFTIILANHFRNVTKLHIEKFTNINKSLNYIGHFPFVQYLVCNQSYLHHFKEEYLSNKKLNLAIKKVTNKSFFIMNMPNIFILSIIDNYVKPNIKLFNNNTRYFEAVYIKSFKININTFSYYLLHHKINTLNIQFDEIPLLNNVYHYDTFLDFSNLNTISLDMSRIILTKRATVNFTKLFNLQSAILLKYYTVMLFIRRNSENLVVNWFEQNQLLLKYKLVCFRFVLFGLASNIMKTTIRLLEHLFYNRYQKLPFYLVFILKTNPVRNYESNKLFSFLSNLSEVYGLNISIVIAMKGYMPNYEIKLTKDYESFFIGFLPNNKSEQLKTYKIDLGNVSMNESFMKRYINIHNELHSLTIIEND